MLTYVASRILQGIALMLVISLLVFLAVYMIGNPVEVLIDPEATQADRDRAIRALGLDRPVWQQYLRFLGDLLRGDVGSSWVYNRPALTVMLERMPATVELALGAIFLSIVVGVPLGLLAGLYPHTRLAKGVMTASIVGFSLPTFWVGIMFIVVFSVELGWLPVTGRGDTIDLFGVPVSLLTADGLSHAILPVTALALARVALVMRLVRAGTQEVLEQDYIKLARAKGLSEGRILRVHVLKNLLIPLVTILGLDFAGLMAFAIVTESVFAWPGMGKLIIDSIYNLDRPMIVAYLVVIVGIFVVVNLAVDLLYGLLDPRVSVKGSRQ